MIISVIVPVYNVSAYLVRCLDSIVFQTFREYDVILVDDGSNDGSGELCEQYAARFSHFHVIHQNNSGLSAARNAGIEWALQHSDSQYLTFVDSDDWVHPEYLNYLFQAISKTGCKVSVGCFAKTNADNPWPQEQPIKYEKLDPEELYVENSAVFITAWGKLFRKSEFLERRFPVGKIHEDEFVIWQIMLKEAQIALVELVLYAYFVRKDGIMNRPWNEERLAVFEALEEQNQWIDKYCGKKLQEYIRRRKAIVCAEQVRGMRAAQASEEIIRLYRRKLKGYIRDARPSLRFRAYYSVYKTAWPHTSSAVWLVYRVCRKLIRWK